MFLTSQRRGAPALSVCRSGASRAALFALLALVLSACVVPCRAQIDARTKQLSYDIFKQLVEIDTTDSSGSMTIAANAMAQRLLDAGFPKEDVIVLGPNGRKGNLVVRFRGSGAKKPILFLGHLDVVEAQRSEWATDPFKLVEKDGYYYGRGTQDIKDGDAIFMAAFIRLKEEGYKPDRDLILALTADEEGGDSNGVEWLLKHHRNLIDAEFALNSDAGSVDLEQGRAVVFNIEASEKLYADYRITATGAGGHSSLPVPDNAIYHLAGALTRLQAYTFPFELNPTTRVYFDRLSALETGQVAEDMKAILQTPPDAKAIARLAANPEYNATMRTTCVATRLAGGHANNALPETAGAGINCRILPGHSREEVRRQLIGILHDPKVTVRYIGSDGAVSDTAPDAQALAPQALNPEVLQPVEKLAHAMWPSAAVLPVMETYASDGIYTNAAGMPTYGISGVALDTNDISAHGRNERVPMDSFYRGVEFYYRFIKLLSGGA